MPLLEFSCERCEARFTELVAGGSTAPCPECGSEETRRLWSGIAPSSTSLGLTGRSAARSNSARSRREERRRGG